MDGTIRNTGAEGLLEILCRGLERDARQRTTIHLGDRSRYVGLSDIAKMLDCPGRHWLPSSSHLNTETLPKLSSAG